MIYDIINNHHHRSFVLYFLHSTRWLLQVWKLSLWPYKKKVCTLWCKEQVYSNHDPLPLLQSHQQIRILCNGGHINWIRTTTHPYGTDDSRSNQQHRQSAPRHIPAKLTQCRMNQPHYPQYNHHNLLLRIKVTIVIFLRHNGQNTKKHPR